MLSPYSQPVDTVELNTYRSFIIVVTLFWDPTNDPPLMTIWDAEGSMFPDGEGDVACIVVKANKINKTRARA